MLGGMKAVTWTQVAQYIILIIAYMTPVVWLGIKHTGIPVPQLAYGYTLQKVGELEKKITADPKEQEVRKIFADRAAAGKAALADAGQGVCRRQGQGREGPCRREGGECARRQDRGGGEGGCGLSQGRGCGEGGVDA